MLTGKGPGMLVARAEGPSAPQSGRSTAARPHQQVSSISLSADSAGCGPCCLAFHMGKRPHSTKEETGVQRDQEKGSQSSHETKQEKTQLSDFAALHCSWGLAPSTIDGGVLGMRSSGEILTHPQRPSGKNGSSNEHPCGGQCDSSLPWASPLTVPLCHVNKVSLSCEFSDV